jgi:hypothetical protein
VVELADDEVGQKEDEGEGEEHERADEGEPLVVIEVLALEIGHPVELSHWGDYLIFIYRFCSKQKLVVILSLTYHIEIEINPMLTVVVIKSSGA